jgi:hypothetical protein
MRSRLGWQVVSIAAAGSLVLASLSLLWLQIPDSHAWEFALSILSALAIVLAVLWLTTTIIRRIRIGSGATPQAMTILAVWIVIGWALVQSVEALSVHVVERAGFWNSRLTPHQRAFFTETRLEHWQNDAIGTLLWFVLPGLLLPVMIETISGGGLKTVARVYTRWQMWLSVGLPATLGSWLTEKLSAWHPTESVRGELISALLRFSLLYVLLLAIALLTLAILSELLARAALADPDPPESIPG